MKYKAGDIVRIRKNLLVGNFYNNHQLIGSMDLYFGKIAKIKSIEDDFGDIVYYLDVDYERWAWTEDMLEPVEEKFTPKDLKTGMFGITNKKRKFLVLNDNLVFQDGTVWAIDFLNIYFEYTDEMESVERIYNNMLGFNSLDPDNEWCFKCIYKREKPKRTLSQIKEELGYDFDLIGE